MGGKNDHEEAQNFKNAMKEMQTDGYMRREKQVPDPELGHVTKIYELYGKPCLSYTNVPGFDFEDQEKSRSIFYQPRTDNDKAVMVFKSLSRMKGTPTTQLLVQEQSKIQNIQKMLIALRTRMDTVNIYNPYNEFMEKYLGSSKYFKRDVDKYDGILRVITAINGYKRPIINDTLFTTKEDIFMFIDILENYHRSITSNLSPGASNILEDLIVNANKWDLYEEGITVGDYSYNTKLSLSKQSIKNYFGELNREGYIKTADKRGQSYVYVLVDVDNSELKSEIELSELDMKILMYNYDHQCVLDMLDGYTTPLNIFSTPKPEPIWNDYLPVRT